MKYKPWPKRDPVKNYFQLPIEIFLLGLSPGALAVYSYLLCCEDRNTYQCWPSYKTIGRAVKMSANTVRKTEIDRRVDDFMSVAWTLLQEKTDSAARSMQERINAVWDLIFDLPVYRNLRLDSEHNCGRYFLLTKRTTRRV